MHAILGVIALILSATSFAHFMHTTLIAVINAKRWYHIIFSIAPGRIFPMTCLYLFLQTASCEYIKRSMRSLCVFFSLFSFNRFLFYQRAHNELNK